MVLLVVDYADYQFLGCDMEYVQIYWHFVGHSKFLPQNSSYLLIQI